MLILEVLAGQEVLNLLLVSIVSSMESMRMFLAPDSLDFLKSSQMLPIAKDNYHVNFSFLATQESILISILSIQVL